MGKKIRKPDEESHPFPSKREMDALEQDVKRYDKPDISDRKASANSIVGVFGEFFDSYVIFAFDLEGNPFIMRKADTPKDMLAIEKLVTNYVDGEINMVRGVAPSDIDDAMRDWIDEEWNDDDDGING